MSRADVGVAFNLRNTGIGPARIEGVRILHKGTVFDGDPGDFFLKMRANPGLGYNSDPIQVGRLVPAESRSIYPQLKALKPDLVFEGAVLEITYSSVFGERWVMRSDNMVPQPQ
jgi:hypothetical protein